MTLKIRLLAAAGTAAAAAVVAAAPAVAYGPSSCVLSSSPSTSQIYFQTPRGTAVTMRCWIDAQWWNGTNRWFYVNTGYGNGYMNANQVSNQTSVPHC